jgi:Flp pilus assembly pilin Flp
MLTLLRRLQRDRSGNMMIEFAFVVPVIAVIGIGIIDFGHAVFTKMSLHGAARVGAEYVSRTNDTTNVTTVVATAAKLDASQLTVTPILFCECDNGVAAACESFCAPSVSPKQFISIDVEQPYTAILDYPGIPNPATLSGHAVLRVK